MCVQVKIRCLCSSFHLTAQHRQHHWTTSHLSFLNKKRQSEIDFWAIQTALRFERAFYFFQRQSNISTFFFWGCISRFCLFQSTLFIAVITHPALYPIAHSHFTNSQQSFRLLLFYALNSCIILLVNPSIHACIGPPVTWSISHNTHSSHFGIQPSIINAGLVSRWSAKKEHVRSNNFRWLNKSWKGQFFISSVNSVNDRRESGFHSEALH